MKATLGEAANLLRESFEGRTDLSLGVGSHDETIYVYAVTKAAARAVPQSWMGYRVFTRVTGQWRPA